MSRDRRRQTGAEPDLIVGGDREVAAFSVSRDGQRLAYIASDSTHPYEAFVFHAGAERPGDAMRAHKRIMQAITDRLVPLRADEPDTPRFHDPTRPTDTVSPWRP